jgi:hypothetical protein
MKKISKKELLAMMDSSTHGQIEEAIKRHQSTQLVLFENVALDSSHLGDRTVVCVGPCNTYKTPQECEGRWLNDLPSVRQYPQCYCDANEPI